MSVHVCIFGWYIGPLLSRFVRGMHEVVCRFYQISYWIGFPVFEKSWTLDESTLVGSSLIGVSPTFDHCQQASDSTLSAEGSRG